jgi:hypothetical protein
VSTPRRRRLKPARHWLHQGNVLVNVHDGKNVNVRVGLPGGSSLQLRVHPTSDRNVVQVILAAFDPYDQGLGSSAVAGIRLPTLAWAYLNTRTGEMTQVSPDPEGDV